MTIAAPEGATASGGRGPVGGPGARSGAGGGSGPGGSARRRRPRGRVVPVVDRVAASPEVAGLWAQVGVVTGGELPGMGLTAGARPAADVDVLCSIVAGVEYELARRMHAAARAGSLPLPGDGAMPAARAWSPRAAHRLAVAGAVAAEHPGIAAAWRAGLITAEHAEAVARHRGHLSDAELGVALAELDRLWGRISPAQVGMVIAAADRMLHPPPDGPDRDERAAYDARGLSFGVLGDTVVLSGALPRLEGELVMAAVHAFAEKLRDTANPSTAAARRADALVELVTARGATPTRGGAPVGLTVTLDISTTGDPTWTTSRGHLLTRCEQRFTSCDPQITPILTTTPTPAPAAAAGAGAGAPAPPAAADPAAADPAGPGEPGPTPGRGQVDPLAARCAALATALLGTRLPLAVGRSARTATPAQRKALAVRDRGCVIPGCPVPAEHTQVHHLHDWATGGTTDLPNLVLLCWTHHRQVDLGMWTLHPTQPPDPTNPPGHPGNHGSPWTIHTTPRTTWRT